MFSTALNGAVVWRSEYLPFGGITFVSGTAEPKQVFPGQWFQGESGLHQNWMRDYDPVTGSYLQPDPLGLVDGPAVYAYAKGAPGVYTDPTGEFVPIAIWGIRIGVAGYRAYRAVTAARTAAQAAAAAGALSTLGSDTPQNVDENDPCCEPIYSKISEATEELRKRFKHQGRNKRDEPLGHAIQIMEKQRRLRKLIGNAVAMGCPNYRKDANYFAWAPVPGPGYAIPKHLWRSGF